MWPLANIAGDDDEHRKTLIRNGVLEPLFANYIACVRIVTDAAAEAEAAGKPAAGAGSADAKESKGSSGSAQSQSQAAVAATLTLLHNVGWTLTNFLEGPKPPLAAFVKGRMLGACVLALRADQPDAQVASDAMWLIHLLVHRGGDEVAAALCEDGLVNALLGRLQRHTAAAEKMVNAITAELAKASGSASGGAGSAAGESKSGADGEAKQLGISGERAPEELRLHYDIVRSALRTVGHLAASGRDAFGDAMLLANKEMAAALLTSIGVCLQLHARRAHRSLGKESAWALANLAAGSQGRRADLIVQAGFVPLLAQLFAESKADVQSECLFALSNLAEHERHRELVVRHEGVLKTVLSCLRYADADVVRAALTFLQRALRSVRGVIKRERRSCCFVLFTLVPVLSFSLSVWPALVPSVCAEVQELDGIEALETLQNSENEVRSPASRPTVLASRWLPVFVGVLVRVSGKGAGFVQSFCYSCVLRHLTESHAHQSFRSACLQELWTFASGLVDEFYGEDYEDDVGPGRYCVALAISFQPELALHACPLPPRLARCVWPARACWLMRGVVYMFAWCSDEDKQEEPEWPGWFRISRSQRLC